MILSTQILWGLQRWLAVVWCSQKAVLEESCMRALQPQRLGFIQQMDFPSALRWGVHQKPGRPTMVCVNSHFAVFLLCKPKYGEDHFAEARGLLSLQSQKMFIHEKSICWALIICWQCFSEHTALHSPGTSLRETPSVVCGWCKTICNQVNHLFDYRWSLGPGCLNVFPGVGPLLKDISLSFSYAKFSSLCEKILLHRLSLVVTPWF